MTPEERQELVDRLRSLADGIEDGQTIQTRDTNGWIDRGNPYLDRWLSDARTWRVKPQPLEGWVNAYGDGSWAIHSTEYAAKKNAGSGTVRIAVHMREVVA